MDPVRIGDATLYRGDALERLKELPSNSIHCCVTSPPYWGLRNYNVPGQLGLEPTYQEYVDNLVEVFRAVRRVLRPDGVLFLNLGDCYATGAGKAIRRQVPDGMNPNSGIPEFQPNRMPQSGLKPKDLMMMPARVALALQADGWYLRSEIIWQKPNPMPESVRDRPTSAHEKIFMLSRSPTYFYDEVAIYEPAVMKPQRRGPIRGKGNPSRSHKDDGKPSCRTARDEPGRDGPDTRNRRNVWTVASAPFRGAHFATFPPALIVPCILAGTSEHGVCAECGSPWARVVGEETVGWQPSCSCDAGVVPATVLDPFAGAGTTALVSVRLGRRSVGIEINPDYLEMARRRIEAANDNES